MALGEVDSSSGFVPSKSLLSLKCVVSYVGRAIVTVCVIPSPIFGYLQAFGISPLGGRVILASTPYERQSILFSKVISAQIIWHNL